MRISTMELGPSWTLRIEQEHIDVTTLGDNWKYDPDWTYVDQAGHHHLYDPEGQRQRGATFPTLAWWIDDIWYASDGDGPYDDGHLCCSLCYEPIQPGTVLGDTKVLGPKRSYLNDVEISEARAKELMDQWL